MDGVLLLPPGVIVNQPGVYQEVAKFDTLPTEKIHAYWNAYTTTYKKLRDPTAHRLENFWWHVWGSDRRRLSGHKLAQIYEHISTGPTFVPLRGPFADFVLPPELASYFQHSDSESLAPNPVASGLDAAPSIPGPSKSTDKSSNYPPPADLAPLLHPTTSSAQRPSPGLDSSYSSSSSSSSSPQSSPEQAAISISESAPPNPIDEDDTDWTSDSTLKSPTGSDLDQEVTSSQQTIIVLDPRATTEPSVPAMSQTTMLVAPTATISVTGTATTPDMATPATATSASGEAGPRTEDPALPPSPPATTSSLVESASYDSDRNYAPISLPAPSSKRPPPKHSILKKNKSGASNGPRPTARFASPDRSEQWRVVDADADVPRNKGVGSVVGEDDQVKPVSLAPAPSSSTATAPSRATSGRAPPKKKVAVAKTSKKFTVAKKRPGLGKRSSTGSNASAHGSNDGQARHTAGVNSGEATLIKAPVFTESPKPIVSSKPAAHVSSSRPGSSKVIVHNERPQPKTLASSHREAMSLSGGTLRSSPVFHPQGRLAPTPEEEEEESALIPQVVKPVVKTAAPKKQRKQQEKQRDRIEERLQRGERLANHTTSKKLAVKQPVVNNTPVIHRAVSDTSVATAGPSRPLDSRDLGLIKVTSPGPVTRRPGQGQWSRPRTLRAQSEIDLPTASVQATKRRLEGKTGIKSSSSMMSLSTATNGFPPRRRHSNGTDNGQPTNSTEDTQHLPPFRRSHSAQSRLNAAANRAASLSHTPSYEHYTLKSTSSSVHDDALVATQGASKRPASAGNAQATGAAAAKAATPRSQGLLALAMKNNNNTTRERSDLISPATVCLSSIVAQGSVYDFDNVNVQLDMMRSRIDEPVVETDYGLPPAPRVRSVLKPMFKPTEQSNVPPVPLGRTRSQLTLVMDRDSEARHGGDGRRAFFSSFLPWLREQDDG